ncbi:hypothetical protein DICVIV_12080 [Dictyocaulus viviparus]|uniref:Uncharacterized protein n=1 Tax=Dictyocaulus viviparus TaxID=29172 RepID=A0A0D8XBF9_DICVI|nr:hypothetical protein DICVIV_12080 [Dictyocaulus viviparus]
MLYVTLQIMALLTWISNQCCKQTKNNKSFSNSSLEKRSLGGKAKTADSEGVKSRPPTCSTVSSTAPSSTKPLLSKKTTGNGEQENFIPYPETKSDKDDTLEQIGSLQREESEKNRSKKPTASLLARTLGAESKPK